MACNNRRNGSAGERDKKGRREGKDEKVKKRDRAKWMGKIFVIEFFMSTVFIRN